MVKRGALPPPGHYAWAWQENAEAVGLARDPLGCNKLFFSRASNGRLIVANRIDEVLAQGARLADIYSCPPGSVLHVRKNDLDKWGEIGVSTLPEAAEFDLVAFQESVRDRLDAAFVRIAEVHRGVKFVVCLSGGMDSAIIASWAARYLSDPTAVTFSYAGESSIKRYERDGDLSAPEFSADLRCATAIASLLDLPLTAILRTSEAVAPAVAPAVRFGQDWRDFNVHCAIVNLFLAQDIKALWPDRRVVVLTGDIMNELICDYHEELVEGTIYYPQPKVNLARRRRFFVRGLDAGDREFGIFSAFGLTVCQPYAAVADIYMRIPAQLLDRPDAKQILNSPLLDPPIMAAVNKIKTRAQVGGADMGTLGICHRLGINDQTLRDVWCGQFSASDARVALGMIEFGRHREMTARE